MASAETFVHELEEKNLNSFQRLLGTYADIVRKEDFSPVDVLRLELRGVVESVEVSAMWLTESEDLTVKMVFARQCGDGARHHDAIAEQLGALGVDLSSFDPRFGGYSKLFAFFRSLQTTEERASGGLVTLRAVSVRRLDLLAGHCEGKGDPAVARLLRDVLATEGQAQVDAGRAMLLDAATTEESQARARRAAFRTIELLGDVYDPGAMRKFLARSIKK